MIAKITIDKAGRVVIPKRLRDRLRLGAGDELMLESAGDRITLRPVRPRAALKKEYGIWVYQGEATDAPVNHLIDREREKRIGELGRVEEPRG
jgi:AbrB family looped-hinge helix DNA binding protein